MMRKPIQIHAIIGPDTVQWQGSMLVMALCDDGSIWERWNDGSWTRLPDIPQDDRPTPPTPDEGRV